MHLSNESQLFQRINVVYKEYFILHTQEIAQ